MLGDQSNWGKETGELRETLGRSGRLWGGQEVRETVGRSGRLGEVRETVGRSGRLCGGQ